MKDTQRLFILIILAVAFVAPVVAQQIIYSYDASGNRVSREYIVRLQTPPIAKNIPSDTTAVIITDALSIDVYPNPTQGTLYVGVNGLKENGELEFRIFNPNGQLMKSVRGTAGVNPLDFSSYTKGWYLLKVITDQKTVNFKIIKE